MKKICISAILVFFLFSACSIEFKGSSAKNNDIGGVFISVDSGNTWRNLSKLQTASDADGDIRSLDVNNMAIDPSDDSAIYFAGRTGGLYYAYDVRYGWRRSSGLPAVGVNDVSINPKYKCTVYASARNKVYKTIDCNRTWEPIYYDDQGSVSIQSIAIDHYNDSRIFIGTSRGEILLSENGGESWKVAINVESSVLDILFSPQDSRILLVRTKDKGIFRSKDGGVNWISLEENGMDEFKNNRNIRSLRISAKSDGLVIATTPYGMLKSGDYGDTWERIELVTPEKKTQINDIAIDYLDDNIIYYVTNSNFYRTKDGGETWTVRDLPTQRRGWKLLLDFDTTGLIYLGVKKVEDSGGIF